MSECSAKQFISLTPLQTASAYACMLYSEVDNLAQHQLQGWSVKEVPPHTPSAIHGLSGGTVLKVKGLAGDLPLVASLLINCLCSAALWTTWL